jgi:hypothetical protein
MNKSPAKSTRVGLQNFGKCARRNIKASCPELQRRSRNKLELIPADYVGRTLSRADANHLLEQLRLGNRAATRSARKIEAPQTAASAAAA